MSSKRELALARTAAIVAGLDGIVGSRNLNEFPAGKRPAANLSDGLEQALAPSDGSLLSNMAPLMMEMLPVVSLLISDNPGTVGTKLNEFVDRIVKAVLSDSELQGILEAAGGTRGNGRIIYRAMRPFFGHSLNIDCDAEIEFGFYYRFNPNF